MKLKLTKEQRRVFSRVQDLGLALRAAGLCKDETAPFVGKPLLPLLENFMAGKESISLKSLNLFLDWAIEDWLFKTNLIKKVVFISDLTKDQRDNLMTALQASLADVVNAVDEYDPRNKGISLKD